MWFLLFFPFLFETEKKEEKRIALLLTSLVVPIVQEKGGDSPLLWAMRANNQDLCVKLLEKERDLNSSNIDELRASKERFTSTNGREECPLSISCKESIQSIVHGKEGLLSS